MKRLIASLLFMLAAPAVLALAPYVRGARLPAAELPVQMAAVEQKLQAAGFAVIGRHLPKGLPSSATIVVTDPGLLDAIGKVGGSAISAAALRVGVQADGSVSYMNPEYWHRAFVRKKYGQVEAAVKASQARLAQALGEGAPFGGNVEADDLASYRYMFGMERFDANSELVQHASFDEALATVRAHLAKGTADTAKVYEVVMPERRIAVFGVAMNNAESGEGWWVSKIEGSAHVAALPYELFIVDNKVYALYARFRIALSWPELGMGQFMGIFSAPHVIHDTMSKVATKP
jgi:hypothetical protein